MNEQQAFLHAILAAILQRDEGGKRLYGDPERVETTDLVPTLELVRDRGAAAVAELLPELADDIAGYGSASGRPLATPSYARELLVTAAAPSRGGSVVARALERLDAPRATLAALAPRAPGDTGPTIHGAGAHRRTTHISVIDAQGDAAGSPRRSAPARASSATAPS